MIAASIVFLATRGLNFGIDFTGGTLIEVGDVWRLVELPQVLDRDESPAIEGFFFRAAPPQQSVAETPAATNEAVRNAIAKLEKIDRQLATDGSSLYGTYLVLFLVSVGFQIAASIVIFTLESNPEGYRKSAPINFAEGLKGDLLIIHGTGETNTHLQITEGLVDRLIELGKRFDYMAYPNRNHGLSEGRGTTVHVRMLITRYLLEHLPPGPR